MRNEVVKKWTLEDNVKPSQLIVGIGIGVKKDGSAGNLSTAVAKRCAEIYRQGLGQEVLMVGGFRQNGVTEAKAMGGVAIEMGVRPQDLSYEEQSTTTFENAIQTFQMLEGKNIQTLILVPQYLHARRVVDTFKKEGKGYQIHWSSAHSKYDDIPGKWQLRSAARFLLWEYF
jgi:uncharacterized SAM-binding protein YcdF (DUF218 family)